MQPRKPNGDETSVREKENCGAAGPEIATRGCDNVNDNDDGDDGRETGTEGAPTGVP